MTLQAYLNVYDALKRWEITYRVGIMYSGLAWDMCAMLHFKRKETYCVRFAIFTLEKNIIGQN